MANIDKNSTRTYKNNTNPSARTFIACARGLQSLSRITGHALISEKEIEKYLVRRTREMGLPCLKYSNPNMVGYPDRLIVLPQGRVVWVELKSRGCRPSKIQQARIASLRALGHQAFVIDSRAEVDNLINSLKDAVLSL
ncbi:MAG: hypothetical protein Q4F07_07625 [Bacteroidales bacterium]|nr:hypothetical protein [Bacteroidales bacterium]